MKEEIYGAPIERGVIDSIQDGYYRVKSFSRDGVVSPPIKAINNYNNYNTYSIGDQVYFFMFDDGDGLILAKM